MPWLLPEKIFNLFSRGNRQKIKIFNENVGSTIFVSYCYFDVCVNFVAIIFYLIASGFVHLGDDLVLQLL